MVGRWHEIFPTSNKLHVRSHRSCLEKCNLLVHKQLKLTLIVSPNSNPTPMRPLLAAAAIFSMLLTFSCKDASEEISSSASVSEYRNVGAIIPTDMGARWIEAFQKQTSSGRIDLVYNVGGTELNAVKNSVTGLVGIAFHYGLDENGDRHIILVPVDATLRLWTSLGGRIYLDANTNSVISKETAIQWAQNYEAANPGGIWFHFFGAGVFDDMISIDGFNGLSVVPALNDLDLSPELLLVVGSTETLLGGILGRTATATTVYDASYPCPRCEVQ
jgi:hypothetical protein